MHLGDQQPKHYDQGNKQEESGEKLFIHVLRRSRGSWRRSAVVDVKSRGKNTKRKGTDAKGHLETAISKAEALKSPTVLRLWSLALRSRRRSFPGVLLACASPSI